MLTSKRVNCGYAANWLLDYVSFHVIFLISLRFRVSHYNVRGGGCNLVQPSYNNQYFHNSFTYKITHLWNKLPTYTKQSPNLNAFHKNLESIYLLNFDLVYIYN